jgi:hypothetical protein
MAIRVSVSSAAADMFAACVRAGAAAEDVVVDVVQSTPVALFKPRIPGQVKPSFKQEAKDGLSVREVFGKSFTADAILSRSYVQIESGQYNASVKLSDTVGGSASGHMALGAKAALAMRLSAYQSGDVVAQDWALNSFKVEESETAPEPETAPAPAETAPASKAS